MVLHGYKQTRVWTGITNCDIYLGTDMACMTAVNQFVRYKTPTFIYSLVNQGADELLKIKKTVFKQTFATLCSRKGGNLMISIKRKSIKCNTAVNVIWCGGSEMRP